MRRTRGYAVAAALAGAAMLAVPATGFADPTPGTPGTTDTTDTTDTATPTTEPPTTTSAPRPAYPFLSISLSPAAPGGEVLVSVGCPAGQLGVVKSKVLDIDPFEVATETPELIMDAVGHVHKDAKTGLYQVSAVCGKVTLKWNFDVKAPVTTTKPVPAGNTPHRGHQVGRVPVGAPQTGGGGTAH
jgi:hypothetical protein